MPSESEYEDFGEGSEDGVASQVSRQEPGDFCTCCNLSLGRRLRPRYACDYCDRGVCSACSFMVQPLGAPKQSRVCSKCISPVEQARSAKERLANIEVRLKALNDEAMPKQEMTTASSFRSLRRPGVSPLIDRTIDEAVGLVEVAVCAAEESRLTAKLKTDQVDAIARMERARREEVESKASQAKDSVVELGDRLREACQACEVCVKPFETLDEASNVEAERWALSLAADRAAAERRVKDALQEAQRARDCLFRLAMRMHSLVNPASGEPICPKPQAAHCAEELARIVERAMPLIVEVMSDRADSDDRSQCNSARRSGRGALDDPLGMRGRVARSSDSLRSCCLSRGKSREPSSSGADVRHRSRSGSSDNSRSRRQGQGAGSMTEDRCSRCGIALGKRHWHFRYSCDICMNAVCSTCSSTLRVCFPCNTAARQEHFPDDRAVRLRRVCETLRALGSSGGSAGDGAKRKSVRSMGLDDLISQCEASIQPLKDLKSGQDVAKALADDVRRQLERNAQAAARANVEFGARLERLYGHYEMPLKDESASLRPGGGAEGTHQPGTDPSSASFWQIQDPRVQGTVV